MWSSRTHQSCIYYLVFLYLNHIMELSVYTSKKLLSWFSRDLFFVSCCHKTNTSLDVKNRLIGAYENVWTRTNKPSKALPSRLICFWIEIVNLLRAQLIIASLYHILCANFAMLCKIIKYVTGLKKNMLILH